MQGWRNHMEDAHIAELNLNNFCREDVKDGDLRALFGVFDGHGGDTVSKFVSKYFVQELVRNPSGDLGQDLVTNFKHMDKCVLSDEGTDCAFHFLKTGMYADHDSFDVSNIDMSQAKERINTIEKVFKEKEKSPEEKEMMTKIEELKEEIKKLYQEGSNKTLFLEKVSQFQYMQKRTEFSPRNIGGTTAVAVYIHNNQIYCANAGDSRAVLSKEGIAEPLSYDHKPSNSEELNRIQEAGGYVKDNRVEGNLALSRAMGDFSYKEVAGFPEYRQMVSSVPDVKVVHVDKTCEFMVIACDGIWDCLENQNVVDLLRPKILEGKYTRLSELIEEIFDKILSKTKEELGNDNMTCIIVRMKPHYIDTYTNKKRVVSKPATEDWKIKINPEELITLEQMEQVLKVRQFIGASVPTYKDFGHLSVANGCDLSKYPNVNRWWNTLSKWTDKDRINLQKFNYIDHKLTLSIEDLERHTTNNKKDKENDNNKKTNKNKKDKKEETKDKTDDNDEIDLFGNDDEEVEITRKKPEKKEKKEKIEKTFCMLDIKPYEAEFDMATLVPQIKEKIQIQGLVWGEKFELKPVAFGVKKLCMSCVYEDKFCESDNLIEEIQDKFPDFVQSVDVSQIQKHA